MAARIIAVVVILVVGAIIVYPYVRHYFEKPPMPPASTPADAPAPKSAGPKYPIEPPAKPLPTLNASDPAMQQALSELFDAKAIERFFNVDGFIRRIVATVDNLPREKIAVRVNPVRATGGAFVTSGRDENLAIGPRNAARYEPAVRLLESTPTAPLVAAYRQFYPLFQQAFVELGYPDGYFNDRLVEVIDHLLEAPEPKQPPRLVRPKVFYEYVDPEMESMSAGHKVLVRMGPENAARVKRKLRELRAALVQ